MVATVAPVISAASALSYMERDGYYAEGAMEHEAGSAWHGSGAALLGLKGTVQAAEFKTVLEGYVKGTDQRIGRMVGGSFVHKPGTDLTLSAPKSVSMAALIGGDKRLIDAHNEAVKKTMAWAEKNVLVTRTQNKDTKQTERQGSQKMVAASYLHDTSRALDPQIHSHVIIANMTQGADGKWRAMESKAFYENKMLLGAVYHNYLAKGCHELGWQTKQTGKNGVFELKDTYTREQIEGFSTRWKQIQAVMRECGLAQTAQQAQQAALMTRQRKFDIDRPALQQLFKDRAAQVGVAWGEYAPDKTATKAIAGDRQIQNTPETASQIPPDKAITPDTRAEAVPLSAMQIADWATRHSEEREAVFTKADLLNRCLAHSPGLHMPDTYTKAIDALVDKGRLIAADTSKGGDGFTTDRAVEAERANLAALEANRGRSAPMMRQDAIAKRLESSPLTDGQKRAVSTILGSSDRIVGVQGYAGSGKTTMLRVMEGLTQTASQQGYSVLGFSPFSSAAKTLEEESGIKSATLQQFLAKNAAFIQHRATKQMTATARQEMKHTILVVDEASLASTLQMRQLLTIVEAQRPARLVLVGDTRQLDAVDAGVPFRQFQHAGMDTAVMDQIMRQRNPELKAGVLDVLAGQPDKALERLGADVLEAGRDELAKTAATRWLMLDEAARDTTGLMAPTHALREDINQLIRDDLKRDRLITGEEAPIMRLDNLRLTTAERERDVNYHTGEVVIFTRDMRAAGIEAGEHYTVLGREDGHVILTDADGRQYSFDPAGGIAPHTQTYSTAEMVLQEGDKIRWTRNDKDRELVNTHTATVTGVAGGMVSLTGEDGRTIQLPADAPQLQHSDYAFNATVHAFQGRTADNVIAVLEAGHGDLTNQKTFYVEISRARDRAIIITEDKEQLGETLLANTGESLSALQGIGDEPATQRGQDTQSQMANTIQTAITEQEMSIEDYERIWADVPPAEHVQDYGEQGYDPHNLEQDYGADSLEQDYSPHSLEQDYGGDSLEQGYDTHSLEHDYGADSLEQGYGANGPEQHYSTDSPKQDKDTPDITKQPDHAPQTTKQYEMDMGM